MNGDLLSDNEPPITLADQCRCVEREIKMRESVYPRWVASGKMSQGRADREIAMMRAVLKTLEAQ